MNNFVHIYFDKNSTEDLLSQPTEEDLEDNFAFEEVIKDEDSNDYNQLDEEKEGNYDDNEVHDVEDEPDLDEETEDFDTHDFTTIQVVVSGLNLDD